MFVCIYLYIFIWIVVFVYMRRKPAHYESTSNIIIFENIITCYHIKTIKTSKYGSEIIAVKQAVEKFLNTE